MKVTTETVGTREVMLRIEPDPEQVEKAMRQAAREISRWRPVPGFRPGKAPYDLVLRIFGRRVVLNEAINNMADALYRQALQETNIEPYEPAALDIESEDPLVLKANVALQPVVTLGDYHALHVDPEPEVAVTEEMIQEELERLRRQHATHEPVERPAQMGDRVAVAIKGTADGETVIDRSSVYYTLDEQLPPPGFAEALVGMNKGETREFTLTYPADFEDSALAGKEVQFTVTLQQVIEIKLPEVNDDLAKMAGDYETLDALREAVTKEIRERLEREAREREAEAALEALVAQTTMEYPAAAVERQLDRMIARYKAQAQQIGFEWERYLQITGQNEQDLRAQLRPGAEREVRRLLALEEFAKAEGIEVDREELVDETLYRASTYGPRAEDFLNQVRRDSRLLASIQSDVRARKALRRLVAKVTGRPEEPEAEAKDKTAEAQAEPAAEAPAESPEVTAPSAEA